MRAIKAIISILTILAAVWLIGYALFTASIFLIKPKDIDKQMDAIVVLTGGNYRVQTGLELLAHGNAKHLFISGVNPDVTRWTIQSLWDDEPALPECCIDLGKNAKTTLENAREVKEWVEKKGFKSIRLVTSNYHMHRAMLETHHAMPDIEIVSHPVMTPDYQPDEKRFWLITFSEYNKVLYRWAQIMTVERHT